MAWTKTIVVVDHDVDVHDTTAVLRAVGERCHPARDLTLVEGPLDILDHAAPYLGAGGKIGLDATRKWPSESGAGPQVRTESTMPAAGAPTDAADAVAAVVRQIEGVARAVAPASLGGHWLLVGVNKSRLDWDGLARVLEVRPAGDVPPVPPAPSFVLILDAAVNLDDLDEALFHWCANSDPGRDLLGDHAGRGPRPSRLVVDATTKSPFESRHGLPARGWPPILRMTDEVRARVDRRWGEYGLG